MHPIITEFINSSTPLDEILEKLYKKENYFEVVFLEVAKTSNFRIPFNHSIYVKIDQAIILGHPDPTVYLLFIIIAIFVTKIQSQGEKTQSLLSIADSLSHENISPVIRALHMQASTRLIYSGKNVNEAIKIRKEAVNLINYNHPRFRTILNNYTSMLSEQGRLNDLDIEELKIFNSPPPKYLESSTAKANFLNCISTGNYKKGFNLAKKYQQLISEKKMNDINNHIDAFLSICKLLSGDLDETQYEGESFPLMVKVFRLLSEGDIKGAINSHKMFLISDGYSENINSLYDYTAINFELCLGNEALARKILDEKKANGSFHYLDDLFYARLQLLEKDFEGANRSLARLLENVDHYGAMNRVQFELKFAKELNTSDLFLILKKWKNSEVISQPEIKKPPEVPIKLNGLKLLIGRSVQIIQVKEQIKKYAPLKEIILVTGETGTGKELVAKALHEESPFHKEPFLAINCGALTDTLLESELFGYEAGSFTGAVKQKKGIFEAAGKGTVFLDEFGDISPKLQVSLLRVFESNEIRMIGGTTTRKVECRIVVATNINLKQAVDEKRFREDLYFRLARLEIRIPALRERGRDIPELVKYFLEGSSEIYGTQKSVSKEFLEILSNYQWPGNIRELKNCIDRLKILNPEKDYLDVEDLSFIQFQGAFPLQKKPEKFITPKKESVNPISIRPNPQFSDDPILNIIIQKGFNAEQRIEYLKQLFQKYKILTRGQVTEIAQINPVTANKDLQKLCDEAFIIKRTPTKSYRSNYYEII